VVRTENGEAAALPPTEIVKSGQVYDYRSKYLPGLSRKRTPIELPEEQVQAIREHCTRLFRELGFQVYARIDGFIQAEGTIYLNDPNTTSGMLPSSFFFHQAAEIGLNPSQFLTFILRLSLQERLTEEPGAGRWQALLDQLDEAIRSARLTQGARRRIGVILGGYSYERHISVESGRNIYEKLASSETYEPIPLFLSRQGDAIRLHRLPVSLLLKDNADDIRDAVEHHGTPHLALDRIREECRDITAKYAASDVIFQPEPWSFQRLQEEVSAVFIALHGRPGEDGELQRLLDERSIPYNGSGPISSAITIDKYRTLQTLSANGFSVADQLLLRKEHYHGEAEAALSAIQDRFGFPLVAKPVDDGCSSAVKVIRNAAELKAYLRLLFRAPGTDFPESRRFLRLHPHEEFPRKEAALLESLITAEGAERFLEVTVGMLTHFEPDGSLRYEVFEPSETLAVGEVLSLEEKFLAGQGQNITPARFGENYEAVARQVKDELERAARILQVEGYCRIDAFVRVYGPSEVETVIIEVNSLPGMTPATAIFHQAALHGYKPYEFIDQILQYAFARQQGGRRMLKTAASASVIRPDTAADPPSGEQRHNPNPIMSNPAAQGAGPWWKRLADRLLETLGQWLRQLWAFLSSPVFLKNFGLWLALLLVLYLLLLGWLRLYTKHGESLQVHNYVGMELDDAMKLARNRSFRIEVSDSVYQYEKPPGTVIQQDPPPESRVKKNRTIYLVINRKSPPKVALPDLSGSDDFQVYCDYLKRLNIECIVKDRVYHGRLEPNTILHFYYEDRKITASQLKRGVEVPRGATLEFVITERQTNTVPIPNLICTGYAEAEFVITNSQLAVGAVYGGVDDPGTAYVYRQEPAYLEGKQVPIGTQINLYIQQNRPENCPAGEGFLPEEEDR
jgi:D-alanine-D-alanine ligase